MCAIKLSQISANLLTTSRESLQSNRMNEEDLIAYKIDKTYNLSVLTLLLPEREKERLVAIDCRQWLITNM